MGKSYNLKPDKEHKDQVYDNVAFDDSQQNGHYKVRTEYHPSVTTNDEL